MAAKSKKGKSKSQTKTAASKTKVSNPLDLGLWPGWVEMESEPAFFNVMLKEMGVRGVKVHEVYSLDEEMLAILPQPVHALIFLFRYRPRDQNQLQNVSPANIWFARQVPEFACATIAMLNIVNNVPGLHLGDQLQDFKDGTQNMDALERGEEIDRFQFVKAIHNSFARETDLHIANLHHKEKWARIRKQEAVAKALATKAKKAAIKTKASAVAVNDATPSTQPFVNESRKRSAAQSPESLSRESTPKKSKLNSEADGASRASMPKKSKLSNEADGASRESTPTKSKLSNEADGASHEATPKALKLNNDANDASGKSTPKKPELSNEASGASRESTPKDTGHKTESEGAGLNQETRTSPLPEDSIVQEPKAANSDKPRPRTSKPREDPDGAFKTCKQEIDHDQPRRSTRTPKPRKDVVNQYEDEEADEHGFHFCAYIPADGHVWQLDGLDDFPQDMGAFDADAGDTWMDVARPVLQGRMAQYTAGEIEFNLMAIVHEPLLVQKEALAANIKCIRAVESKLNETDADWRELEMADKTKSLVTGPCEDFTLSDADVEQAEVPACVQKEVDGESDLLKLLEMRKDIIAKQAMLRAACRDELESSASDNEKARLRRHDLTGFVKAWVEALAEQNRLDELVEGA